MKKLFILQHVHFSLLWAVSRWKCWATAPAATFYAAIVQRAIVVKLWRQLPKNGMAGRTGHITTVSILLAMQRHSLITLAHCWDWTSTGLIASSKRLTQGNANQQRSTVVVRPVAGRKSTDWIKRLVKRNGPPTSKTPLQRRFGGTSLRDKAAAMVVVPVVDAGGVAGLGVVAGGAAVRAA